MRKYEKFYTATGSYDVDTLAQALLDRVVITSNVSSPRVKLEDFQYVIEIANRINTLDEFDNRLDGYDFKDVYFPKCLEFLIWPSKVSMVSSYRAKDLLPEYVTVCDDKSIYSPKKMISIIERIYSTQKENGEKVSIQELRVNKLLNDVEWFSFVHEESVMPVKEESLNWLIPVKDIVVDVFGEDYFIDEVDYILNQFIIRWSVKPKTSGR